MSSKTPETTKTVQAATKLPSVPESVLKRRKRNAVFQARLAKHIPKVRKTRALKRRTIFKKAAKYAREYEQQEKQAIRLNREAKAQNNFYVPPQPKLALVIRIRGINQMHPKPRKILQLLRLRQINNATFVRLSGATIAMLRLVEPYVVYGYPNLKTVQQLVYKRGFGRIRGIRTPIVSNAVIEKALGKSGITCVEDLIHEIYTVGPNFKTANHFLWAFHLNPPRGGWTSVTTAYTEGGDFGNREEFINQLIRRMV
jgi:large subunit ribosomal protein L7e